MAKLSRAEQLAQNEFQAIKSRIQSLQTQFLHIDSPAELDDGMQAGGLLVAKLLLLKPMLGWVDFLLTGIGSLSESELELICHTKIKRQEMFFKALLSSEQQPYLLVPVTDEQHKMLEHLRTSLDEQAKREHGPKARLIWEGTTTIPVAYIDGDVVEICVLRQEDKTAPGSFRYMVLDTATNYRRLGKLFSSFCAELLARIEKHSSSRVHYEYLLTPSVLEDWTKAEGWLNEQEKKHERSIKSSSSISEPTTKKFTPGELVDELDKLLTKASQYYTAEQVRQHLLKNNPGKTIGLTAIKEHPIWKKHNREWGNSRAARNTSRQAEKSELGKLIAQQKRREQQTRHRGVDRIADGD